MSFVPIRIMARAYRQADATVAVISRYGQEYVDFRFSPTTLRAAGWNRAVRIAAFHDPETGELMFTSTGDTDPSGRALVSQGGHTLSARWPRVGPFAAIFSGPRDRTPVRVIRVGAGQVVIDPASTSAPAAA